MVKDGLLTEKEGQSELDELESRKKHNMNKLAKQSTAPKRSNKKGDITQEMRGSPRSTKSDVKETESQITQLRRRVK